MSWGYRTLVRPVLFRQDSERIHDQTLRALAWAGKHKPARWILASLYSSPSLPVDLFGLRFPNPIGLAAGMDKQAAALPIWSSLGFGFTELGGVTWEPQPGNPKPRMFRAVPHQALVNRMGFNNAGASAMAIKLAQWRERGLWPAHPVGINLGKSKNTPLALAAEDYAQSFAVLWPQADFFVINVSSPNTPGLRKLQDKSALGEILSAIQEINKKRAEIGKFSTEKPVLIKVAPDLEWDVLDEILELSARYDLAGIIATNTTLARPETLNTWLKRVYSEAGGLSGGPLARRSTEIIRHIYRQTNGCLPIIGVGGIFNAADAWEKITAGASLLQIYTGLVFNGPAIAKSIVSGLKKRLQSAGLDNLAAARGIGV